MAANRTSMMRIASAALAVALGISATAQANAHAHTTMLPAQQDTMSVPHGDNVRLSRIEVPAGTTIRARMDSKVSSRHSTAGEPFFASTVSPILDTDGRVLVPEGSQVLGRVLGAHQGGILFRGSRVAIGVDALKIDGRFVPVSTAMTSLPVDHYRAGLLFRRNSRIASGSVFQAQLQAPITVGVMREVVPMQPRAVGGGPAVRAQPRATGGGPATTQAQPAGATPAEPCH